MNNAINSENGDIRKQGNTLAKKIASAIKEQSWLLIIINLAWTAGPLTYLGLQGGYYLGYGKFASTELFIYFVGYTAITGIGAIVIQVIRKIFYEPKIAEAKKQFLHTIDGLYRLYFALRNAFLESNETHMRPLIASWWVLRNIVCSEDVLEEAVYDITQDEKLSRAMKRVEIYRKQGLMDRVKAEYNTIKKRLAPHLKKLNATFPELATTLNNRLQGIAPSLRTGQPRPTGFLERIITAINRNDANMATPNDAMALITLTLELLCGRKILILQTEVAGNTKLEKSRSAFESTYAEFHLTRRKRNGRMRTLIEEIKLHGYKTATTKIDATTNELKTALDETLKNLSKKDLQKLRPIIIKRMERIKLHNKKLNELYKKVERYEKEYNKLWQQYGDQLTWNLQEKNTSRKPVLTIKESIIALNDKDKMELAKELDELLQDVIIRKSSMHAYMRDQKSHRLDLNDFKEIVFEITDLLDDKLNIAEPYRLLAIERSPQANISAIEVGLSTPTKAGWTSLAVEEVQLQRTQTANRLAKHLSQQFNVPISPEIQEYLSSQYQVNVDLLMELKDAENKTSHRSTNALKNDLISL